MKIECHNNLQQSASSTASIHKKLISNNFAAIGRNTMASTLGFNK